MLSSSTASCNLVVSHKRLILARARRSHPPSDDVSVHKGEHQECNRPGNQSQGPLLQDTIIASGVIKRVSTQAMKHCHRSYREDCDHEEIEHLNSEILSVEKEAKRIPSKLSKQVDSPDGIIVLHVLCDARARAVGNKVLVDLDDNEKPDKDVKQDDGDLAPKGLGVRPITFDFVHWIPHDDRSQDENAAIDCSVAGGLSSERSQHTSYE